MTEHCVTRPAAHTQLFLVCHVLLYRDALMGLLDQEPGFALLGVADPDDDAVSAIAAAAPNVVLLDAGARGALSWAASLVTQRPHTRVLGFGVEDAAPNVIACAQSGLWGYVPSTASIHDLLHAARRTARGETVCSPTAVDGLFRHVRGGLGAAPAPAGKVRLTRRQSQIAGLLGEGMSNKEIARKLSLDPSTVKNHVHDILDRMQVTCRTEAAIRICQNL
jgi:DNA-binding NarL/FixJ family response regulator